MKTKDDMLKVFKKWYSDIADIRHKYDMIVEMRDNAGEKIIAWKNGVHPIIWCTESFQLVLRAMAEWSCWIGN